MDPRPLITGISAQRLGEALRQTREARGVSVDDVADRLGGGISGAVIQMIESAMYPLSVAQLDILLKGYEVERDELFPSRQPIDFDDEGRYMAVGWNVRELSRSNTAEEVLAEYLSFVYEMRGVEPGTPLALREEDLEVLSRTIDRPVEEIRHHLIGLMFSHPVAGGDRGNEVVPDGEAGASAPEVRSNAPEPDANGEAGPNHDDAARPDGLDEARARFGANRRGGLRARLRDYPTTESPTP